MLRRTSLLAAFLVALLLPRVACAQVGGEFTSLEQQVAHLPNDAPTRLKLAGLYEASGFLEEAAAQYVAVLALEETKATAQARLEKLLAQRGLTWLPEATARVAPFSLCTMNLDGPGTQGGYSFLVTTVGFAAHEGERQDRTHGWRFPRVAYGYVLEARAGRWQMKVRVHSSEAEAARAQEALKLTLALYGTVRSTLGFDPTRKGRAIDVWVCEGGPPGARAVGNNIYLYAAKTERAPAEWVRELAHEYGHMALPGLGGFTQTDDPWADGDVGELLFVKWLAARKADWLPWSVPEAEQLACVQRAELLAKTPKPIAALLDGKDVKARDHLLGLVLRVEGKLGPGVLAEVLSRAARGNARRFVGEAEEVGKARGVTLW